MKTLGIIGGLGPLAGAYFYRRLIELSPATADSEHIPVILISDPTIPSRIEHLSGTGESPVPKLVEVAQKLMYVGADFIAMPSTTTSIYHSQIAQQVSVPMVSLIEEVTLAIANSQCRRIGIMGTTPTRTFRAYEGAFRREAIEAVYPDDETQSEIMTLIHTVKQAGAVSDKFLEGGFGSTDALLKDLGNQVVALAHRPWSEGLDGILLACTELPVIFPFDGPSQSSAFQGTLFRSTDILAKTVVQIAFDTR
ncbi:aspartate/glutamate racemase family protein [Alicyclobacillus mengziensis]|uniref:Aspartate/glutamate racemase family protein n=1 Tax=Alicyclobacillus mengziensis TaxID=2931921 RepID=A0A9X7Z7J1_9BACL|nr:amino acid racemase [Alicyclobacillus mengziensis]QSO47283.1 aspartate/glutamate racemase family protein [Alicyclobacillus mengziensis]